MPDAPDSFRYTHISTLIPSIDVNELAAKLNSPSTNFREGQIIYQNDFRDGTKGLYLTATGAGQEIYTDNTYSTMTGMTLILSTSSATYANCSALKQLPLFDTQYFIYSYLFTATDNAAVKFLIVAVKDGYMINPQIVFDFAAQKVYVYDALGVAHDIGGTPPPFLGAEGNIRMHLKIDIANRLYVSLYLNDNEYSLAGISLWSTEDTGVEYQSFEIQVKKLSGVTNAKAYVNAVGVSCSDS